MGNIVSSVEIGEDIVRLATVQSKGKYLELLQKIEVPVVLEGVEETNKEELILTALENAFKQLKYKPSCFALSVPCSVSIVRSISVPFRGLKKVVSALRFELEPHIPFPIEELLLDFIVVNETKKETEVLTLGVRKQHIQDYIRYLDEFSAKPETAIINSLGLVYLWEKSSSQTNKLKSALLVDKKFSAIVITYAGKLVFIRHLVLGKHDYYKNPEVFAREVQNSLRAFLARWKGEEGIEKLEIGGLSLSEEELGIFSRLIKIEIEPVSLTKMVHYTDAMKIEDIETLAPWNTLVGVAGIALDPYFSFNLLKENQSLTAYLSSLSKYLIFTNCLILTGLVCCAFFLQQLTLNNVVYANLYKKTTDELTQEIDRINQEKGLDESIDLTPFFDPPLLDILNTIAEKLPSDKVNITEIRLSPPDVQSWWIRIQGTTSDSAFINQAISELKKVSYFNITDDPELSAQGSLTSFSIRIQKPQNSQSLIEDKQEDKKESSTKEKEK
ncbi:MAG TPA: pilus assembly protein PilM [Candidatus Hydrogenedens sp.]|nr:pilus assembly protein PilM [Candidatus Hydrogenedens sp.]